jgi:hypothetical protein
MPLLMATGLALTISAGAGAQEIDRLEEGRHGPPGVIALIAFPLLQPDWAMLK